MAVGFADVADRMVPLAAFREELAAAEPEGDFLIPFDGSARIVLGQGWGGPASQAGPWDPVDARVEAGGEEYGISKAALLAITSGFGITKEYAVRVPEDLLAPHLQYWMGAGGSVKAVLRGGMIAAVMRPSVPVLGPLALFDAVTGALGRPDAVVDYKRRADLSSTQYRLVLPDAARSFDGDSWSVGVDVECSATGASGASLNGYLFRWVCTNGMISTHAGAGTYSRRAFSADPASVLGWAAAAVEDVLSGLEHEFEAVEELRAVELGSEAAAALRDVFSSYSVPPRSWDAILEAFVAGGDTTAYGLLNAVTSAANADGLDPAVARRLMRVGGDIPAGMSSRCAACHRIPV